MYTKETSVCFTGHRSEKLPKGADLEQLKENLANEIQKAIASGYNTFYSGMAYGWDLICSEVVLQKREERKAKGQSPIMLVCAVPFRNQAKKFSEEDKSLYEKIIDQGDLVIYLRERYSSSVYKLRNQYLVDHSNFVIAYCNRQSRTGTRQTINMAEKAGVPVLNLFAI